MPIYKIKHVLVHLDVPHDSPLHKHVKYVVKLFILGLNLLSILPMLHHLLLLFITHGNRSFSSPRIQSIVKDASFYLFLCVQLQKLQVVLAESQRVASVLLVVGLGRLENGNVAEVKED